MAALFEHKLCDAVTIRHNARAGRRAAVQMDYCVPESSAR